MMVCVYLQRRFAIAGQYALTFYYKLVFVCGGRVHPVVAVLALVVALACVRLSWWCVYVAHAMSCQHQHRRHYA